MADQPRDHPGFLLLLGIACAGTVPFLFVGPTPALALGLPLWLWWSLAWTLALAGLTSWGLVKYWRDDDDDD